MQKLFVGNKLAGAFDKQGKDDIGSTAQFYFATIFEKKLSRWVKTESIEKVSALVGARDRRFDSGFGGKSVAFLVAH